MLPEWSNVEVCFKQIWEAKRLTKGPCVECFEQHVRTKFDHPYVIAVSSASVGLDLVYRVAFRKQDKQYTVPAYTWVSTVAPLKSQKRSFQYKDIDITTLSCDSDISTHVFGVKSIAENAIVYDSAQRFAPPVRPKEAFSVYSLSPTKMVTTAEGGIISCPDKESYNEILQLREYVCPGTKTPGTNARMSEFHAAIGVHSINLMETHEFKRTELSREYDKLLYSLSPYKKKHTPTYTYPILLKNPESVAKALQEQNIEFKVYFEPCHFLLPTDSEELTGYIPELPITEQVYKSIICLPVHAEMTTENVHDISKVVISALT